MNMILSEKMTDTSNENEISSVYSEESDIAEEYTEEEFDEEDYDDELSEEDSDFYIDPEAIFASAKKATPKITSIFPVNREKLYINKIYKLLQKLTADNADEETICDVAENIEDRLQKTEELIEETQSEEYPPEQEEIHKALSEAFEKYHQGLTDFLEFLTTPSEDLLIQSFNMISRADSITEDIQESIKNKLEFNTISSVG
ncbi:MAG: hypothetical protein LWY06_09120 [Firmicutes bacterium]|nr:hypothetical protein [Bacillota bacterium]